MDRCLKRKDITLLWHIEYYDMALSGILELDKRVYFFNKSVEDKWFVYPLTDEETREETRRQELFQKYVGYHTGYDRETQERVISDIKPRDEWNNFYNQAKTWPVRTYTEREPIGWFVL